ncbi:MAG: hypothetical protein MK102_13210 [Fuerstiella sp.]|nr:hypothetical protein [Fuerstiella sp.]
MLWAWYRPQSLPLGLIVSVPMDVQLAYSTGFPFSLADILLAAVIEPAMVHSVSILGSEWKPPTAFGPLLHHGIPAVIAGAKPEIAIQVMHQTMPPGGGGASMPVVDIQSDTETAEQSAAEVDSGSQKMMYERIEKSWQSSIQMERQCTGLRQKLASIMAALGKLDRDLAPDERLAADREDRDAWQEARRWMRDLMARCHREVKSFDIGMTSAAGKRNAIEQLYQQVIEPRAVCRELADIRREFETYRKDMVNLQKTMQSTLQASSQNGTQRAHRVLAVISKKIRDRRAKMREALGGTNIDKSVRRKS